MKTFKANISFLIPHEGTVEIEAETKEDAEGKLLKLFANRINPQIIDVYEAKKESSIVLN